MKNMSHITNQPRAKRERTDPTLYCSFCGKSQHEVRKLIAGPTVFICDGCVDLCSGIVHKDEPKGPPDLETAMTAMATHLDTPGVGSSLLERHSGTVASLKMLAESASRLQRWVVNSSS